MRVRILIKTVLTLAAAVASADLFALEPFYQGKTIGVAVGASPGNSQDQVTPGEFGWPVVAPSGVPGNRIIELRGGFKKTLADPELIAQAKKRQIDVTPSSGAELEALAKEVMAQPREVVERMKILLGN
jgi:hypothetical protein